MTSSASSRKNCKQALYAAIERVNTFTAIFALCTSILGIMYTLILKSNKTDVQNNNFLHCYKRCVVGGCSTHTHEGVTGVYNFPWVAANLHRIAGILSHIVANLNEIKIKILYHSRFNWSYHLLSYLKLVSFNFRSELLFGESLPDEPFGVEDGTLWHLFNMTESCTPHSVPLWGKGYHAWDGFVVLFSGNDLFINKKADIFLDLLTFYSWDMPVHISTEMTPHGQQILNDGIFE